MHEFLLFVSIQLHKIEGGDLRERDESYLLCQAKKGKKTLRKIHHTITKV